ncbi:hypothetical protein [Pseudomonas hormoni]
MSGFEREGRYIVVKPDCMDSERTMRLKAFIEEMCFETPDCVVVEADWPEYELVWKMLEERVTGKQSGSGWGDLKRLADEVNAAFPDKEDLWSMTCTPNVVLDLIADIERLGLTVGSLEFAKWSCQVNQEAIIAAGHETIDDLATERDQLKATVAQQAQMIEHLRGGLTTPTNIDVANADADGYRNGFAAAIKSLPEQQYFTNWAAYTEWRAAQIEAVGDFGGEVRS